MTPVDHLTALLARGFVVVLDGRAKPVCVTVHTQHGPRHFHGADVARALAQAHHALTPRAQVIGPQEVP